MPKLKPGIYVIHWERLSRVAVMLGTNHCSYMQDFPSQHAAEQDAERVHPMYPSLPIIRQYPDEENA